MLRRSLSYLCNICFSHVRAQKYSFLTKVTVFSGEVDLSPIFTTMSTPSRACNLFFGAHGESSVEGKGEDRIGQRCLQAPLLRADAEGASVATVARYESAACDEESFSSPKECALAPLDLSAPRSLAYEPLAGGRLPLVIVDKGTTFHRRKTAYCKVLQSSAKFLL